MANEFDPILIEVMRHQLMSVSEEMNITMKQTTRSIVAKEGGDYSAGLLDPAGRVMSQAVPYGLAYFNALSRLIRHTLPLGACSRCAITRGLVSEAMGRKC